MKNLREFVEALNEARTKKNVDMENIEGVDAEDNGTGGKTGFNEPIDNEAEPDFLPKDQWDTNMRRISTKFKGKDDFFIIGKAGWGKTSIIKSFAKKYGYEVITQYLDKCEATDLGGIPIAGEDKKTGQAKRVTLMPEWAQYMKDRPKQKFLLFFDEMNQAAPDVMNALMPIVLEHEICGVKFDNFFVGAAGNYESENAAVNDLNEALESRFIPLIEWESNTTKAWESAIKYMHKKWDKIVSKELIDELAKIINVFKNPREVEQKFLERYVARFIQEGIQYDDVEECTDNLRRFIRNYKELSRTEKEALDKVAELTYEIVNGGARRQRVEKASRGNRKGVDMVPENVKKAIHRMMTQGYFSQMENGKAVNYGISKENISVDFFAPDANVNQEMLRRLIDKFEQDGVKWKFKTDAGWKKAGYKDPNEELLITLKMADLLAAGKPAPESRKKRNYSNY